MTENEQIEEMARVLHVAREHLCHGAECKFYMTPHTEEFDCRELWNAEKLYSAGYRKVERGEWGFDGSGWTCSECGEYALCDKHGKQMLSNNCPNCGADMRGEDNG